MQTVGDFYWIFLNRNKFTFNNGLKKNTTHYYLFLFFFIFSYTDNNAVIKAVKPDFVSTKIKITCFVVTAFLIVRKHFHYWRWWYKFLTVFRLSLVWYSCVQNVRYSVHFTLWLQATVYKVSLNLACTDLARNKQVWSNKIKASEKLKLVWVFAFCQKSPKCTLKVRQSVFWLC